MTAPRDPDRLIDAFLREGPSRLGERTIERTLSEIHRSYRRVPRSPWRITPVSRSTLVATAAVIVIGVSATLLLLRSNPSTIGNGPTPPVHATSAPSTVSAPAASPTSSLGSPSPAPTTLAGASGTIVYQLHQNAANTDYLYAISADGGSNRVLVKRSTCCVVLAPRGDAVIYGADDGTGLLVVGYQGLDGSTSPDLQAPMPGLNLAPGAWSANNDLAFEGWNDTAPGQDGLYVSIDNGGGLLWGDIKRLTTTTGGAHDVPLTFSPDGTRLIFLRERTPGQQGDLYVVGTNGSGLRRLSPVGISVEQSDMFGPGASWSKDGKQVAFAGFDDAAGGGASAIYVVGTSSGTAKVIVSPNTYSTSARFSPDGSTIAFDRQLPGSSHHAIFLVHPDGTGLHSITDGLAGGDCCAQWSPDGTMLLVQGGLSSSDIVDLWIVRADGSGSAQLTHNPGRYNDHSWSSQQP